MDTNLPKPVLKWAGGKRKLAPVIDELGLFPDNISTYYEPFYGAGAIYFYLWSQGKIKRAILSDINTEIINLNIQIRDNVNRLIDYSADMDLRSESEVFDLNKKRFNELKTKEKTTDDDLLERAVLMIYLNKTSFSGMYRENSKGLFNVPFGKYKNPTIIDEENMILVSKAYKNAIFKCGDFKTVLSGCKPRKKAFVYMDPPYMPNENGEGFTAYNKMKFSIDDQIRLKDYYYDFTEKGIRVMLSNSSEKRIKDLYSKNKMIKIKRIPSIRSINARNGGHEKVDEYLVTNYER